MRLRNVLVLIGLVAVVGFAGARAGTGPSEGPVPPPTGRMESVCFYLPDGTTLNLRYVNPPRRGDALEIHSATVETAMKHREAVLRGEKKATGFEDRMVLTAILTDQWGGGTGEGGLSCKSGWSRSGMRVYNCSCDAVGTGCIRLVVQ